MQNTMIHTYYKWNQTIQVFWSNLLVYKVNFFLQVIGPMLVFLLVKVSLWSSIFRGDFTTRIGGYDLQQMLTYQLWIMLVTLITLSSNSQQIAEEIRMGRISIYLLYPFSLFENRAAQFVGRQLLHLLMWAVTLALVRLVLGGWIGELHAGLILKGLGLALLASVFWFALNFIIGLLAFWLEETWTLMVLAHIGTSFLSGSIIPLEFYPAWIRSLLVLTPFPYIGYAPTKVLMGEAPLVAGGVLVILVWILAALGIAWWIWRRGIRLYTAAGM